MPPRLARTPLLLAAWLAAFLAFAPSPGQAEPPVLPAALPLQTATAEPVPAMDEKTSSTTTAPGGGSETTTTTTTGNTGIATSSSESSTSTSGTTTSSVATSSVTTSSRTTSTSTTLASAPASGEAHNSGGYLSTITGSHLRWVELSLGGLPVRVQAGGVAALHPDAPFRVLRAEGDGWLDYGLQPRLEGLPEVDLNRFHTLNELLGEQVFNRDFVNLEVWRGQRRLGSIQLLVRLLPIDWLRRAEKAASLEDKIAYTQKALDLTPDDRLLVTRLADLLVEAQRYREAAALLEGQPWLRDDQTQLARLTELYQRGGETAKAMAVVERRLELSPQDTALLGTLAQLQEQDQHWEQAAALWERLSQLQSGSERAATYGHLAQVRLQMGQPGPAAQALEQAVRLQPFDAVLWQSLAEARQAAGNPAGALEAQRQAATLAPADQQARLRLVEGLLAAGRKAEAAAELEKAALLSPEDPGIWLRLARLYEDLGDKPALVKTYRHLTRQGPHDPDLDFNLGVILAELGRYQEALDSLAVAAQGRPQDREIQRRIMALQLKLGRGDRALDLAKAQLQVNPDQPELLEQVYAALAKDQPQAVAALLDQALTAGSKHPRLYLLRASLALEQEDTLGAAKALELGVKNLPDNLELWNKLASLYEAAGQENKALKAYEHILDQAPNQPGVQDRYLSLKTNLLEREERPAENKKPR